MKRFILPSVFLLMELMSINTNAQMGNWVWMKGDTVLNSLGVYGVKGIANSSNEPVGMYAPISWTDNENNFWIFGGVDTFGHCYNALWKFDPITTNWTWVSGSNQINQSGVYGTLGIPSAENIPGARSYGSLEWTDKDNDLWFFGGSGYDENGLFTTLADLWKYDITTNEWTWMGGFNQSSHAPVYESFQQYSTHNFPGSRGESIVSWIDANNYFWFFGGWENTHFHNDVWSYNTTTNEWAWMKGDTVFTYPNYGVKGIENPTNDPGSRYVYSKWIDANGDLWIFGGRFSWEYSDLWKLDHNNLNWTWMAGTNVDSDVGSYGNYCDTIISHHPRSRWENRACWIDSCGNFWMFGGFIYSDSNYLDFENDLWFYNSSNDIWSFAKGDSTLNVRAKFGLQGIPSPENEPRSRGGAVSWTDKEGNFWLFGGSESASFFGLGSGNDLWKFIPDLSCLNNPSCYIVGMNEIISSNPTVSVFPNPFTSSATITLTDYTAPCNIQLFDQLGRETALHYHTMQQGNRTTLTIDRCELLSGMYFLSVNSGQKRAVVKVMVE